VNRVREWLWRPRPHISTCEAGAPHASFGASFLPLAAVHGSPLLLLLLCNDVQITPHLTCSDFTRAAAQRTAKMSATLITDVDKRKLAKTKFPPEFNQKVDMSKVNNDVIKVWVKDKLADILGNDDDVVVDMVYNLLDLDQGKSVRPGHLAKGA
jgi:hypothetical protein